MTVTGHELERHAPTAGAGLSMATTFASAAAKKREERTYYVRDAHGQTVHYAESHVDGTVTAHTTA